MIPEGHCGLFEVGQYYKNEAKEKMSVVMQHILVVVVVIVAVVIILAITY